MSKSGTQTVTQDIDPAVKPYRDAFLNSAFNFVNKQPLRFAGFGGSAPSPFATMHWPRIGSGQSITPINGGTGATPATNGTTGIPSGGVGNTGPGNQGAHAPAIGDWWSASVGDPGQIGGGIYFPGDPGGGGGPIIPPNIDPGNPNNPGVTIPDNFGNNGYGSGYTPGVSDFGWTGGGNPFDMGPVNPGEDPWVAGMDPAQLRAMGLMGDLAGQKIDGIRERMDKFMNPYQDQVVNASRADFDRQRALMKNRVASQATKDHVFGGSRAAILDAEGQDAISRNEASTLANLRYGGWNSAINAAGMDANVALGDRGQRLSAAQSLYGAGNDARSIRQAGKDAARGRFDAAQNFGLSGLNVLQSALTGLPMGMSTSTPTYSSPLLQGLGLFTGLGGIPGIGKLFGGK